MEVFGHIVVSFTRGVTEHINTEEHEYTAVPSGYDLFARTGLEWYHHPVDELIYQEYSEREATLVNYIGTSSLNLRMINACSTEENEETPCHQSDQDTEMAWKRLRPSALYTACKSMYFGILISVVTASIVGSLFMLISYLCYRFISNCELYPKYSIPVNVQWIRSISDVISCAFLYTWFFVGMLLLFRPYQLYGAKGKLILVICLCYFLDTFYRLVLQALGISHSKLSTLQKIPLNLIFFLSICCQAYLVTNHFCVRRPRKELQVALFLKMTVPLFSIIILAIVVPSIIYPLYNKQKEGGKLRLIIAIFAPVVGVVLKVISRICVQRLWNITHPGYSYVLLAPLYCATAVMFRMLQADLDSLKSIAILGLVHGAVEVLERSTMVVIDHVLHLIWQRQSAPWGSFRTPRRERLIADIAIMSMLFESAAIVSVNGILYLYQFIYVRKEPLLELLQSFAKSTSVSLVIEWFFTSLSLTIETHYQNMAVMAVWKRRWKKHILVAIVTTVSMAIWTSGNLSVVMHERFQESLQEPCKMPFA